MYVRRKKQQHRDTEIDLNLASVEKSVYLFIVFMEE